MRAAGMEAVHWAAMAAIALWFNDDGGNGPGTAGDPSDPTNIYEDAPCTVAHGAVSTTSDDLSVLAAVSANTNFDCHDLIGNGFSVAANIATHITGTASNLTWQNGVTNSGPMLWSGVTFNYDPTGGGVAINASGSCAYNVSITHAITDDGTGTFASGQTFSGTLSYAGTLDTVHAGGATFSGQVTANAISDGIYTGTAVTCPGIFGGNFSGVTIVLGGNGGDGGGATLNLYDLTGTVAGVAMPFYNFTLTTKVAGILQSMTVPPENKVSILVTNYGPGGLAAGSMPAGGGGSRSRSQVDG